MPETSIQVQSVLYHNEPHAIRRAVESIANAVDVARREGMPGLRVHFSHGDASKSPVFSAEEYAALAAEHTATLTMACDVFGENTGTAKGHNRLAEGCEADYIMIMNPDVLVNPRIFLQLLAPFEDAAARVGITEARQTPIEHHKCYDAATGETSWISTACALFPTAVYREVGGFDSDAFFMYCDDLDFAWRVRLAGYKAIFVPGAPVYHAKRLSATGGWLPTAAEIYYSAEAALLLAHKWSAPARCDMLLEAYSADPESPACKAAAEYRRRRDEGRLPAPIDPGHTVASFTDQGYGEYRFMM